MLRNAGIVFYVCESTVRWARGGSLRRRWRLRRTLHSASEWEEYRKAARELDDLDGMGQWRTASGGGTYQSHGVRAATAALRAARAAGDAEEISRLLGTMMQRGHLGAGHRSLFAELRVGTKAVIEEYVAEQVMALRWLQGASDEEVALAAIRFDSTREDGEEAAAAAVGGSDGGGAAAASTDAAAGGVGGPPAAAAAAPAPAGSSSSSSSGSSGSSGAPRPPPPPLEPRLPLERALDFFERSSVCLGHTALCLSGGGALSMYHMGVVKALLENGCMPTIVSGPSPRPPRVPPLP